jgi:hypothetical protein
MANATALVKKREELKRRMTAGEYKTLVDVFLAGTDRLLQKITRQNKPLSIWVIILILSLVSTFIGLGWLYIAGELPAINDVFEPLGIIYGWALLWATSLYILLFADLFLVNQYTGRIFIFWCKDILDATESTLSLENFEDWLESVCNKRQHLLVTITGGILFSSYVLVASRLRNIHIGYSLIFGIVIMSIVSSATLYLIWMAMLLSARLREYQLKLFASAPGSSELLFRLSSELGFLIYIVAISGTIGTLEVVLISKLRAILGVTIVLFVWLPLIAIFILNQTSLSSLIRRNKWKTLKEIQVKVQKLQVTKNFGDKETLDAVNRLMDYHDRVKTTTDSALNVDSVLSFINSLLLPLLAFLLGNLDKLKQIPVITRFTTWLLGT